MNIDPTNIVIDKYQEDDKKRKRVKKLILHIMIGSQQIIYKAGKSRNTNIHF